MAPVHITVAFPPAALGISCENPENVIETETEGAMNQDLMRQLSNPMNPNV